MCDISQINVCLSLDSKVNIIYLVPCFIFRTEYTTRHIAVHIYFVGWNNDRVKEFYATSNGSPIRVPCSNSHWILDSTGTYLPEKVIGQLTEAVLLLTEVDRARQRKDNKGRKSNEEKTSFSSSLETRT